MEQAYLELQQQAGRPIPGQSLTNDPENPLPFERPPEYTSVHAASEYLFEKIIEEETYVPMMQALASGTSLMELTQIILFKGFTEAKWNPDLMLMLVEPVAYMLLALAERMDIDVTFYTGEEEEEEAEEKAIGTSFEEAALSKIKDMPEQTKVPKGVVSNEIMSKIDKLPEMPKESLMAAPAKTQPSLLATPA